VRLAIYARYSSDQQNERSIDDQVRLCREHATRIGAHIVGVYADYALSGEILRNRPQAVGLLADARSGNCDAVLTESLDRLSRDQEDIAGIFKRLRFAGVRLLTVVEGEIGELHIGLKGTMNALFLRDLAAKIRRGQRGRTADGLVPGGRSYGYEVVRELDGKGELLRGRRRIKEDEAAVIRRIFQEYASGRSARSIAAGLNRDSIPSPAGKSWNASTINGSRARASGILYNEAYIGKIVYNRTTFSKDPDSGRRVSKPLPTSDRVIATLESLRIIPDDLWLAAKERKARYTALPTHQRRRPRHLFSGLVFVFVVGRILSKIAINSPVWGIARRAHAKMGAPSGFANLSAEFSKAYANDCWHLRALPSLSLSTAPSAPDYTKQIATTGMKSRGRSARRSNGSSAS